MYEGAPTIVSTFFAVVPKIAILGLFLRLFYFSFYDLIDSWQQVMVIASLSSMVLASLVALQQKKLKRFLAYSSIGHVGYMLVGFATGTIEGVQALLLYSILYVILVLSAWTFVLSTEKQKGGRAVFFTDLSAMSRINPLMALTFTAIMFSSAGVPPLSGFPGEDVCLLCCHGRFDVPVGGGRSVDQCDWCILLHPFHQNHVL